MLLISLCELFFSPTSKSGLNLLNVFLFFFVTFLRLINNTPKRKKCNFKILNLSLCFFMYIISYVYKFMIFLFSTIYIYLKIWATGALIPHCITNSTTLPRMVFLSICNVCNDVGQLLEDLWRRLLILYWKNVSITINADRCWPILNFSWKWCFSKTS